MSVTGINSIGPPPERHADRVVAEMLQHIARASAHLLPEIKRAAAASSDGSPRAQRKLEARIIKAGAFSTMLKPGKRGRYELGFFCWGGWNPDNKMLIAPGDALPAKPWLAIHLCRLLSNGEGRENVRLEKYPAVFVTHHALSRLAQRATARTAEDLLYAMVGFWDAAAELLEDGKFPAAAPLAGWRVPVKTPAGDVVAVLQRDLECGAFIVKTVLAAAHIKPEENATQRF